MNPLASSGRGEKVDSGREEEEEALAILGEGEWLVGGQTRPLQVQALILPFFLFDRFVEESFRRSSSICSSLELQRLLSISFG